ncbi:MAG TPA: DUF805 domain-containing protein [Allosphingosinicella sp.]
MEYVFLPLKRYAQFTGRSRRKEFWFFWLFYVAGMFVFSLLDSALGLGGQTSGYAEGASVGFSTSGGVLTFIFLVALFVPMLAVTVRRLHDIDKSGWMILIGLIPLFGWFYLLYLYVQPGTSGPNSHGPDPKADDAQVFA